MNQIEYGQEYPKNNRQHKSTVFCKVFSKKKDLLDLYNALNGTNYMDEEDLEINTLENVIYMTMKNDVSFIVDCSLNLYEHQSTFNPNMPLRGLIYFSQLYNKYVETNGLDLFSTVLQEIPTPQYVVFYNGNKMQPDKSILKLSEAFVDKSRKGSLECEVYMLNINCGHNKRLMEKCRKLEEYAVFVDTARKYASQNSKNPRKAFAQAVEECIQNNILKELLVSQKAEVLETMLTTFNKELYEKNLRERAIAEGLAEGRAEGLAEGLAEGRAEGRKEGRKELLVEKIQKKLDRNLSVLQIAEELEEDVEVIRNLIDELLHG